jgi:hypothetical protein
MLYKLAIAPIVTLLATFLVIPASRGYAENAPLPHRGPWPIWHWHNHQPRRDQLRAMHKRDLTSEEAREVDRLYWELESPGELAGRTAGFACSYRHHRTCRERAAPHSP